MVGVSKFISPSTLLQVPIHCIAIVLGSAIHPKWSTSPAVILILHALSIHSCVIDPPTQNGDEGGGETDDSADFQPNSDTDETETTDEETEPEPTPQLDITPEPSPTPH